MTTFEKLVLRSLHTIIILLGRIPGSCLDRPHRNLLSDITDHLNRHEEE